MGRECHGLCCLLGCQWGHHGSLLMELMWEVGSSACGLQVGSVWGGPGVERDSIGEGCEVHPVQAGAVCPKVELPYPSPMGRGWGHCHELEHHRCTERERGDQDAGTWGLLLSAIREPVQSPTHGGRLGWGRDKGTSAG